MLYYDTSCTGFPMGNSFDVFHNCHSSASSGSLKNVLTGKHVVMHTSSEGQYTQVEERLTELPVLPTAMKEENGKFTLVFTVIHVWLNKLALVGTGFTFFCLY